MPWCLRPQTAKCLRATGMTDKRAWRRVAEKCDGDERAGLFIALASEVGPDDELWYQNEALASGYPWGQKRSECVLFALLLAEASNA